MSSQVLSEQSLGAQTFVTLVRAHAAATRKLSSQLSADHGLTLNDFEVLLRLARAPDRRMRRVDLAEQILLTASGVTRLLDGLERSGYCERASCETDRRVVYAVLTDVGLEKLREAAASHFVQIEELFGEMFAEHELEALTGLLARLGGTDPAACEPPE
jgi:MarR family 2-MHQ and catechol resistance regulon transcriptional repressor